MCWRLGCFRQFETTKSSRLKAMVHRRFICWYCSERFHYHMPKADACAKVTPRANLNRHGNHGTVTFTSEGGVGKLMRAEQQASIPQQRHGTIVVLRCGPFCVLQGTCVPSVPNARQEPVGLEVLFISPFSIAVILKTCATPLLCCITSFRKGTASQRLSVMLLLCRNTS